MRTAGEQDEKETVLAPEPTGGVRLNRERRRLLAAPWEATTHGLRTMDEIDLDGVEPATVLVWEER